jgi:hypothetical protein
MPIRCKLRETRPPVEHKKEDRINRETDTARVATCANKTRQYLFACTRNIGARSFELIQTASQMFRNRKSLCARVFWRILSLPNSLSHRNIIGLGLCVRVLAQQLSARCLTRQNVNSNNHRLLAILRSHGCGIPLGWWDIPLPRQHVQQNRRLY